MQKVGYERVGKEGKGKLACMSTIRYDVNLREYLLR